MTIQLTDSLIFVGVALGFAWTIASAVLDGRLTRLSAEKRLGIAVPPLLSINPFKNWTGLLFVYGVSPRKFGDAFSTFLIYIVRLSFPLAVLILGFVIFARR